MLVNYQYRAYPDTNQKLQLNEWLRVCRYWYNSQLGERFKWWDENRCAVVIPKYEHCNINLFSIRMPRELKEQPWKSTQEKKITHIETRFSFC